MDATHESIQNQQISIENWIEKYIPLVIQHRIYETMENVLDKKQLIKLKAINDDLTTVLREEILKDTGHSRLKQKTLDIISKLRVEARVLTTKKDTLRENLNRKKQDGAKKIDSEGGDEDNLSESSQEASPEVTTQTNKRKT